MVILGAKIKVEAQPLEVAVVAVGWHFALCQERGVLAPQFDWNVNHQELSVYRYYPIRGVLQLDYHLYSNFCCISIKKL